MNKPRRKPPADEVTLKTRTLQVERKVFTLALRENSRERFLSITEEGADKWNCIQIPVAGLRDFARVVAEMLEFPPTPKT